ncbi:MAG: hypothetical protein GC181_00300 [Bacteroidetes bacterium]|nr:hypothetical protein [Bacteroidota bacterium]
MEWVKILGLFAVALYYLFSKVSSESKNTPKKSQPKRPGNNPTSLEEILRELSNQTQTKSSSTPPKPVESRNRKKLSHNHEQEEYLRPEWEAEPKSKPVIKVKSIEKIEMEPLDHHEHDIDLKQAIIYDAILNRPYR